MAYNFPDAPTLGQVYQQFKWDGEKWVTNTIAGYGYAICAFSDTPPSNPVDGMLWYETDSGLVFCRVNDGNSSQWVSLNVFPDTSNFIRLDVTSNFTKGYTFTPFNLGTLASFSLDPTKGNYQYGTNNAAFTLSAPAVDCAVDILVTNGASAGAITFSGFTIGPVVGDVLSTTNGNKFIISVRRINATATYLIKALQ